MMSPEVVKIALGAFLITVMFCVVIISRILHIHSEERKTLIAIIFNLNQTVEDLEARKHPFKWKMRSDGVDVVVERGRPDLPPPRQSVEPTGNELVMPEMDDLPKWGDR